MTKAGVAALIGGVVALALGLWLQWTAFDLVGTRPARTRRSSRWSSSSARPRCRSTAPSSRARVPKGSPAIAVLTFANRGRRTVGVTIANQPFGGAMVRTVIPRLRRGERGLRTYRLPTRERGIFDVGPVEVTRRDSFELVRSLAPLRRHRTHLGVPARARPAPAADRQHAAPRGPVVGHVAAGQHHLPPAARLRRRRRPAPGALALVRTHREARRQAQRRHVAALHASCCSISGPGRYTAESFESAVDIAASVLVISSANKAPVELRLTDGTVIGGPRLREVTPLIDHLTGAAARRRGDRCSSQLLALRRARGGTSLVVVTGVLDRDDLPYVAALRRRFERLVVVSIDDEREHPAPVRFPGVRVIVARDADEVACRLERPGPDDLELAVSLPVVAAVQRGIRAVVPYLFVPLCLVASVLATVPWLRSFPSSVAAVPMYGAAVVSVLVPLVVVRIRPAWLWLSALIDLVAFVAYALLVVVQAPAGFGDLWHGLFQGPSQILTYALPLVSPRTLMAAPVALIWLAGALAGECAARRWYTLLPYLGFLVAFGLAYAATQRASGSATDSYSGARDGACRRLARDACC